MPTMKAKDAWTRAIALEAEAFALREAVHDHARTMEECTIANYLNCVDVARKSDAMITVPDSAPIWILSMCVVNEGGGDVVAAGLFATEKDAKDAVRMNEVVDDYWGCVDWTISSAGDPRIGGTDNGD